MRYQHISHFPAGVVARSLSPMFHAFLEIGDFYKAQEVSDKIRVEDIHRALDIFAGRYCPVIKGYGFSCRWTIMQAEYATDIIFKRQSDLKLLYEPLVRCAIYSVRPDNIASFLGGKLHWNYQGEMGNNFNTRILGTKTKHHMGALSIKMYDKFGLILRIEITVNNVSPFKHCREVIQRDETKTKKTAPMKKNIYSLFPLADLLKASNHRYLEFISTFPDPSQGIKKAPSPGPLPLKIALAKGSASLMKMTKNSSQLSPVVSLTSLDSETSPCNNSSTKAPLPSLEFSSDYGFMA